MKLLNLLFFLPLAVACSNTPADRFVLRGTVPGAMDSTEIRLRFDYPGLEMIKGYIVGERFELTGRVPVPVFASLRMNNGDIAERRGMQGKGVVKYREANFFIENGDLTLTTPHVDSLPHSFADYDIRRENGYTLRGSASHDVYDRYRRQTMDLQADIRRWRWDVMEGKADGRHLADLERQHLVAIRHFIASQRNLFVNLYLARNFEFEPFTYKQADIDTLTALFADYADTTAGLRDFREYCRKASAYVQGTSFAGGKACTPAGDTVDLKTIVSPGTNASSSVSGRYVLLDFWASWCMPCRASFPHLRRMYEAYASKVDFISVSFDKKDADWRQAMQEERLPWAQFCATSMLKRDLKALYNVSSIPTFLLINPEGRIVFSGHSGEELEMELEKL